MGGYVPKPGASSQATAPALGTQPVVQQARTTSAPLPTSTPKTTQQASGPSAGVQAAQPMLQIASPEAGINKTGCVDNSDGAPLYSRPAEVGGVLVRDDRLPPGARVFVSGTAMHHPHWWYVTADVNGTMVRGYVQDFRINTELPEPLAELRQLNGGEKPEDFAVEKFGGAVTDGHDLRYYENVLLYVNRGRKGIQGTYQDPGLLGGGSNNIQLYAGHRIWLVSAAYAKTLQSIVPSGSLTGGAVAKAKRFAAHLEDILHSVTESPHHFQEVAGEFAQAIRDHMPAIVGITATFVMAEAGSMFLAATPTGVGQAAAAVIQLALSAFGAAGMVEAGIEALKHATAWLTMAWTAHGRADVVSEASREFVRMLVAIAIAALNRAGAKANYRNALRIANQMPTGGLPAVAAAMGHGGSGASAGAGAVAAGPGAFGAAGSAALRLTDGEKEALGEGPDVDDLQDKNVEDARARERHDRQAAQGRKPAKSEPEPTPTRDVLPPQKARTELAKHIPPPGEAFIDWFDSLSPAELERLLADEGTPTTIGAREIISEHIRHPGTKHEWLMVAEARRFKQWGVSMRTVLEGRTATLATIGKRFRHGAVGSGTMHTQLRAMIRSSNSFHDFLQKLNDWADRELVPSHSTRWPDDPGRGRYSLPENLQVRGHK